VTAATTCPFCVPHPGRLFYESELVVGLWDGFPVSRGHALLVPRRHVAAWWDASLEEQQALLCGLAVARETVLARHKPDGFNIGINDGAAAGQTVPHLHVHLIPRYSGDVRDPRGGVRHVIPDKANYLTSPPGLELLQGVPHHRPLVRGGADPLLAHLRASMARARDAELAVAFVTESGLRAVIGHLRDLLDRGGRLRLVTTDYMSVTEPEALTHLLDLQGDCHLRVFEAGRESFHPKAYLFCHADGSGTAYVGSSNLTATALGSGVEWNYRVVSSAGGPEFPDLLAAFEHLFAHPATRPLTADWVRDYGLRRVVPPKGLLPVEAEPCSVPRPHEIQMEALGALEQARRDGHRAGLVVMATGLGKTWLAAFDTDREEFRRVLFVAHREEILDQAAETFRRIRPAAVFGRYTGTEKVPDAEVLFASVQTLGRLAHLRQFAPDRFDYVVIDEFHHAAAATYRRLIDHFDPRFLLGLTATPERTDGGDLLALCQENLVYRCDLADGIRRELLSPFRYYGVPDGVDYRHIPWRSSRFDEEALTAAVATRERAGNVLEQHRLLGGKRALGFCCSRRHADFMAAYFREHGVRAVAVHSGPGSAPRTAALEQLEAGDLDVVFAVDMFNEGVDLPQVDTVIMLRPTESRVVWLQQFGRGLRKAAGKAALVVIDYIGNHRTFLLKVRALLGGFVNLGPTDADIDRVLVQAAANRLTLPPGCEITYDLQVIDVLRGLLRGRETQIEAYYRDFRERHGVRPRAAEAFHDGFDPRSVRTHYGSWLQFVGDMGDLAAGERTLLGEVGGFLRVLETTPMTRSFKMVTLRALLGRNALPGSVGIDALVTEFRRQATRSPVLLAEVGEDAGDERRLRSYLERNPIAAWVDGKGTGGTAYFAYDGATFSSTFAVPVERVGAFQELVSEIVEWRLAAYLGRSGDEEDGASPAELWKPYLRQHIPPLFGLEYSEAVWNAGFVKRDGYLFLLATLEKEDMAEKHQYRDQFLSRHSFRWDSQNRMTRDTPLGKLLRDHRAEGYRVHLFVRPTKKIKGRQAPYYYCGEVEFIDWEGDAPIRVRWRLHEAVPDTLRGTLQVPADPPEK